MISLEKRTDLSAVLDQEESVHRSVVPFLLLRGPRRVKFITRRFVASMGQVS